MITKLGVWTEEREIVYFKRGDPVDKEKITGRGKRIFLDITVTTRYTTGHKDIETFCVHVFRGEVRIIVPPAGRKDKKVSMNEDDFRRYAERRWGDLAFKVLKEIQPV
jgi:hypothetical protein